MKTFLTLLFTIIVLPLLNACATPSQIMADTEVRRLCEKDGGITVYETVALPAEKFDKYNQIRIPNKRIANPRDGFYYESFTQYFDEGYLEIWQSHYKVFRTSDNKLLGEVIRYSRRGGDIPGPWHPSSFGCPEEADFINLKKKIFIKK